jgi:YfiH family protein
MQWESCCSPGGAVNPESNLVAQVYPFDLAFMPDTRHLPLYAAFSFIYDGIPLGEIKCGISSRFAGDMKYSKQNPVRLALFDILALPLVYGLEQVHSRDVLAVDRNRPPAVSADGMVSADREIALSVTVADCMPVYLFDTESGAFGLVHSGWKGTGIALRALELMREHWRTRPEAVAAVLGPCIGSCCYKVDENRAAMFESKFGAIPPGSAAENLALPPVTLRNDTDCRLDLKAANIRLLAAAGVRNIAVCGGCTFCDDRLGSFRREGAEHYTRMAAFCGCF